MQHRRRTRRDASPCRFGRRRHRPRRHRTRPTRRRSAQRSHACRARRRATPPAPGSGRKGACASPRPAAVAALPAAANASDPRLAGTARSTAGRAATAARRSSCSSSNPCKEHERAGRARRSRQDATRKGCGVRRAAQPSLSPPRTTPARMPRPSCPTSCPRPWAEGSLRQPPTCGRGRAARCRLRRRRAPLRPTGWLTAFERARRDAPPRRSGGGNSWKLEVVMNGASARRAQASSSVAVGVGRNPLM